MTECCSLHHPPLPRVAVVYGATSILLASAWLVRFHAGLWIMNALAATLGIALARSVLGSDWHRILGWSKLNLWLGLGFGLFLVVATQLAAHLLLPHLPFVLTETQRLYARLDTPPGPVQAAPIIWLVVIAEEFVYRGVVTLRCARTMSATRAILSSTALYVVPLTASGSWLLVVIGITLGALWSYVALRTNGILVTLIAHAMWSCSTFIAIRVA